ncbi:acyl-CoA dehydrogenase family protein [Actinoplanes palleronii]|uniref:Acyl-CoA dehydrogenase n=1 Tax=Actinoplanes palleronii TaxID=113570 RepID=A0ABQ4BA67_9ACTN|nr:acyl-CoA dehydrogenase family protein [Actinoplanes palleronii]GIE67573.1 acyl-CoA dehydrogenase [Actinoplanes palleronii]
MTLAIPVQAGTDLVDRAARAVPVLREHARWQDEHRELHTDTLAVLREAGILRMRVPQQYGGHAADATTMLKVITELARGDGSAAWLASVWSMCGWLAGLFPDAVQDEVFADPDGGVCGVLSPTAVAVPRDGGLVVSGEWHFISGARHSGWQLVLAMAPTPDGASQWPVMALVPLSDLTVVDDWDTSGLRGTGSVTTVAREVFIPAERVLPMPAILQGQYASARNAGTPLFHAPMMATGCASFTGTAIGLAQAALEDYRTRLDHKITYTDYASRREAPVTHRQLAEATLLIDEAQFHATRLAGQIDERAAAGQDWTPLDRVAARAALGRVFRLAKEAVDLLVTGSGGSSIYAAVPIQRIQRDIQALNLHALMHPDTNLELFGRVLAGLAPNTMYL